MRLLVNDRVLLRSPTGVGHYLREILARIEPRPDVAVRRAMGGLPGAAGRGAPAGPRPAGPAAPARVGPGRIGPGRVGSGRVDASRLARRPLQAAVDALVALRAIGCDLYHEPNHCPVPARVPIVTTIHDLSGVRNPRWHPPHRAAWYRRHFLPGLRRTTRFIAVSEHTKSELVQACGIDPARVDVTPLGPRAAMAPLDADVADERLRPLGVQRPFLLFVGTLEPRKNVGALLDAWSLLPSQFRHAHQLVLAGGRGWSRDLDAKLHHAAKLGGVLPLGYVDDDALPALYSRCLALLQPSLDEGFGLPVLEAMACGAPVVVSTAAAIVEVAGPVAGLSPPISPGDVESWADAIARAAADPAWRRQTSGAGRARSADFSWQRCAELTVQTYRAALAGG